MARMARLVVPHFPHHVTQRGNRRQKTFFCEEDYRYYIELLSEYAKISRTAIWAYCLMPNHVHLVMVPAEEDGLRATLGEAHRRYTRYINFRERLCDNPEDWHWSSARAHLTGHDDKLVQVQPMLDRIDNWRIYLSDAGKQHHQELIKRHTRTGRPLGGKEFVRKLETLTGKELAHKKPGRKRNCRE